MLKRRSMLLVVLFSLLLWASPVLADAERDSPAAFISSTTLSQGESALLTVAAPDRNVHVTATWKGRHLPFYYETATGSLHAVVGIDLDEPPGKKTIPLCLEKPFTAEKKQTIAFTVHKKVFPVQRLTLPESQVTLSKKDLERHRRERASVVKAMSTTSAEKLWLQPFVIPVSGRVSTPFGVKRILNNKPRNSHTGVDLSAPRGTPVIASSDGIVMLTGDHFFSGKTVFIDHGVGIISMYFHLSEIHVAPGDAVRGGQKIGLVGSTGRSTGPHLHWGIRINNQRTDPFSLLTLLGQ